ncbi:hypothetical protein DF186_25095, partial [Enterococcus hirae]
MITSQINKNYQTKDPTIKKYLNQTQTQLRHFSEIQIQHIPRKQNARTDAPSKLASTKPGNNNKNLLQKTLQSPSVL